MKEGQADKILIVDDEEAIRFFVADSLAEEGWFVTETDSGEGALIALADTSYDVVLLDLRMPGLDGLEVMYEVKKQWPDTQIIIMTGYAPIESAVEAVRHGAFDYLRKPCNSQEIVDSVCRALSEKKVLSRQRELALTKKKDADTTLSSAPAVPRHVRTGKLIIDLDARTVSSSGKSLALTPTEYKLLAMMAQSAGQPVSLGQLIEIGLNYDPHDPQAQETLRVHISRLRNKIGAHYILTIRGGGYVLVNIPPTDDATDPS